MSIHRFTTKVVLQCSCFASLIDFQSYLGMSSFPSKVGTALKISYHIFFKSGRRLEVHENQNLGTREKQMRKMQSYTKIS